MSEELTTPPTENEISTLISDLSMAGLKGYSVLVRRLAFQRDQLKPNQVKILVIGDRAWGKGDTLDQALNKMKENGGKKTQYIAYVVHPDSYISELGDIVYPTGCPPKEIHRRGIKPKVWP